MGTRIHEVVDELLSLIGRATSLRVLDGPVAGVDVPDEYVVVGFDEESAGYEVETSRMPGYGQPRMQEDWSVRCWLVLRSGSTDLRSLRDRAARHLGAIDAAVRVESQNESLWQQAMIAGSLRWQTWQDPDGCTVAVWFPVEGTTLL